MPRRNVWSRWTGARRLNLYCVGSGSPTVILDAGSGNCMATWRHVQAEIAKITRVCAYDRAGLGFSDAAERPCDLRNIVDDLHRLVKAAPIAAPFVYVGHSLAGAIGLLYVATYPEDIAGAVMVEPAFAGEVDALEALCRPTSATSSRARSTRPRRQATPVLRSLARASSQRPRPPRRALASISAGDPGRVSTTFCVSVTVRLQTLPRVWEAQMSELDQRSRPRGTSQTSIRAELDAVHPSFGDKPLIVLTRGVEEGGAGRPARLSAKVEAAWRAGHDRIAALSTRGDNTIVPGRPPLCPDRPAGGGDRRRAAGCRGDAVPVAALELQPRCGKATSVAQAGTSLSCLVAPNQPRPPAAASPKRSTGLRPLHPAKPDFEAAEAFIWRADSGDARAGRARQPRRPFAPARNRSGARSSGREHRSASPAACPPTMRFCGARAAWASRRWSRRRMPQSTARATSPGASSWSRSIARTSRACPR